ncbi:MAG: glycosyltransferase family 9 protein [Gallionella sp.]|nr:glycosyltransferase family 9 protein [Gallionella sp.]
MRAPQRILVVATLRIGDVLLTTPLIRSLRRAWPQASIAALVFAGTEGILQNNPDIDDIITVSRRQTFFESLHLLWRLWRSYDLSISTMTNDRATLYARIGGKHAVGAIDAGAKHQWKRRLLSQYSETEIVNTHTVLNYLRLADLLGIPRCQEVVVGWQAANVASVHAAIPFDLEAQPYVVLHAYPMYVYKAWRQEAWIELAGWLQRQGMRIVLTGGNDEAEKASVKALQQLMPAGTVNVAGKLGFSEVAYLLSKARAFVGPDTVVTHLAAAVGTPTVALFGPSNPVKWGPWPNAYCKNEDPYRMVGTQRVHNVVLLQGSGDCVPCMEEGCDRHINSLSRCLQELPATRVVVALKELGVMAERE